MDKKKLRNDIILIISLLAVAAVSLILIINKSVKTNLVARISVQNNVVEVIDLSKKEEKDFYIDGINGKVHVHTIDGSIAIVESNCPHQDCVRMGYISDSSHPIICAYNGVYITIDGETLNDVELG
ncbi:MAG: NusG domain II-containing protein [Bacilli bacterium]|nr:NusG domain II-containing protein [Bacilli bacterium]